MIAKARAKFLGYWDTFLEVHPFRDIPVPWWGVDAVNCRRDRHHWLTTSTPAKSGRRPLPPSACAGSRGRIRGSPFLGILRLRRSVLITPGGRRALSGLSGPGPWTTRRKVCSTFPSGRRASSKRRPLPFPLRRRRTGGNRSFHTTARFWGCRHRGPSSFQRGGDAAVGPRTSKTSSSWFRGRPVGSREETPGECGFPQGPEGRAAPKGPLDILSFWNLWDACLV